MLLKVTYSARKHIYYDLYYMFTMIYGEILKMGEKWLLMLSFLTFHGLFNANSMLPKNYKNYVDTSGTSHFEKVNFNP